VLVAIIATPSLYAQGAAVLPVLQNRPSVSPAAAVWNGSFAGWTVQIQNQTTSSPCLGAGAVSRASFNLHTGALNASLNSSVDNPTSCYADIPTQASAATTFTLTSPEFTASANCLCVARANWNLDWQMSTAAHVDKNPKNQSAEADDQASASLSVFDLTTNAFWPGGDYAASGWLNNYSGVQDQNGSVTSSWDRYLSLPTIVALSRGDEYIVSVTLEFRAGSQASDLNSRTVMLGSGNSASATFVVVGGTGGSRLLSVTLQ
jgi:hypothetical protein